MTVAILKSHLQKITLITFICNCSCLIFKVFVCLILVLQNNIFMLFKIARFSGFSVAWLLCEKIRLTWRPPGLNCAQIGTLTTTITLEIQIVISWIFFQGRKNSSHSPILSPWRPSCFQGQREPFRRPTIGSIY